MIGLLRGRDTFIMRNHTLCVNIENKVMSCLNIWASNAAQNDQFNVLNMVSYTTHIMKHIQFYTLDNNHRAHKLLRLKFLELSISSSYESMIFSLKMPQPEVI